MTVKAFMPVRTVNLVAPLGHKPTDRHTTDTTAHTHGTSGAATQLIGALKPCRRLTHTPPATATWAWYARQTTATKNARPCAGR